MATEQDASPGSEHLKSSRVKSRASTEEQRVDKEPALLIHEEPEHSIELSPVGGSIRSRKGNVPEEQAPDGGEEDTAVPLLHVHRYIGRHEPRLEDYRFAGTCSTLTGRRKKYELYTLIYLIRSFAGLIFRPVTILGIAIAVASTVLCYENKVIADLPMQFIAAALFFPISFGINFTINRRDNVLNTIADLKSSATAVYCCCREWQKPNSTLDREMREALTSVLAHINMYLMHKGSTVAHVYAAFERITILLEMLRVEEDWIRSVMSRAYQYNRYMMYDFERLRVIHDYRTPSSLRAYALIWLSIGPALFGPFFAKYSVDYGYWAGIYGAVVVSMVLIGLYAIQADQEDPFDGVGVDDLNADVLEEPAAFMWDKPTSRKIYTHAQQE